jgi:hypothetical protein
MRSKSARLLKHCVIAVVLGGGSLSLALSQTATGNVDFRRDVQPLLTQYCIECHGPSQQMHGFRLDRRRAAMRGGTAILSRVSAPPVEYQLRSASLPISPAIPDFDAAYSALVTRQVNCPCRAAAPNAIPNLNLGVGAILEMHYHALYLNVATLNKKPYRPEPPARVDTNAVMIAPAIYTRISEAFPPAIISPIPIVSATPLGIYAEAETQYEQQRTEQTN